MCFLVCVSPVWPYTREASESQTRVCVCLSFFFFFIVVTRTKMKSNIRDNFINRKRTKYSLEEIRDNVLSNAEKLKQYS